MAIETPEAILSFWLEDVTAHPEKLGAQMKRWYSGGKPLDAEITQRFGATVDALASGLAQTWASQAPRQRLAAIIALDQFSRSIHRNSPNAFASDPLALRIAKDAIAKGDDKTLHPIERIFLFMPFEHAEDMAAQREAIRLFEALQADATDHTREAFKSALDYAHRHADVIAKFGRFPHRNDALGRASTREERVWVKQRGGF
ncbi:MAG: hypothetical protein B7Y90_06800 [Alphaproteobacteria bacterium 32-64-14]|nr:MAG: hypothetical protein B7Y90_06800 [Alphaproteobacteria bacterium 32-64-14]